MSHEFSLHAELFAFLRRLDGLIGRAIAAAEEAYGPESFTDRFRGLHISPDEVERLLAREPVTPVLRTESADEDDVFNLGEFGETSQLDWLARVYGLSSFDLDVLLIALAPELDLRYERLYAYLQDDVTRRRPSIDLALNLLCQSAESKIERRAHFSPDSPLIRHGLMHLLADPAQPQPPLLAHYFKLDEQIVRWLLNERSLDERLASFCELIEPARALAESPLGDEVRRSLASIASRPIPPSGGCCFAFTVHAAQANATRLQRWPMS